MSSAKVSGPASWISIVLIVFGAIFAVVGISAYAITASQLSASNITVAEDASCSAGKLVRGPYSAWCQAEIIDHHALAATGGLTYAQLPRPDADTMSEEEFAAASAARTTAMNGALLRSALFTSILAFGVSAMAAVVGVLFVLIGIAIRPSTKPATA